MDVGKRVNRIKKKKQDIFNHGAKMFCMCLLLVQMVGLDFLIIIEKGSQTNILNRYKWVVIDAILFLIWLIVLIRSYVFDLRYKENGEKVDRNSTEQLDVEKDAVESGEIEGKWPPNNQQTIVSNEVQKRDCEAETGIGINHGNSGKLGLFLKFLNKPLALIPIIWVLYASVLVGKLEQMFSTFALSLPQGDPFLSSTFVKISLGKTAFILTVLIYAIKSLVKDPERETMITDKMASAAALDVIDSVMLLGVVPSLADSASTMSLVIRGFGCFCFFLPVVPLISIFFLAESKSNKVYHLNVIVNTASRMLFGNIPHLVLRLTLWQAHKIDISAFLIKNVIVIFMGIVDIADHVRHYRRSVDDKQNDTDGLADNIELETATM